MFEAFMQKTMEWMRRFSQGEVSLQEWLAMEPGDRAAMAGAFAGNLASHHPVEAYQMLTAGVALVHAAEQLAGEQEASN